MTGPLDKAKQPARVYPDGYAACAAKRLAAQQPAGELVTFSRSYPENVVLLNGVQTDWQVIRLGKHVPGKRKGVWQAQRRAGKPDASRSSYPTRTLAARAALGLDSQS